MKFKILIYIFVIFIIFLQNTYSDEININSSNIKILEEGNIIDATNVDADIPNQKIEIEGDRSIYDKKNSKLTIIKNVKFLDKLKNVYIEGDKVIYYQSSDLVQTFGKTFIKIEGKYDVYSSDLFYDRKLQKIYSNKETIIKDKEDNIFNLEDNFVFNIITEIISSDKTVVVDNNNNEYRFEKAKIDIKNNEIAGKELEVDFVDSYFGDPRNDPKLKGKGATSDKNKTKIYKAVFTTCNTENKKCPGWELQSEEFIHNKEKKLFEYKNSWLKVFNQKVAFFPFFSHPDPTVKRKSGFLTPTYGTSDTLGTWVNTPYFKVISDEKDMTFNPRIYADDKIILQAEYRQAFENSFLISDFSFNNDGRNTNTHLFANFDGALNPETSFSFQYQNVTNDNYLKMHNLSTTSLIIGDESLLTTKLNLNKNIDDYTSLDTNFTIYEDLSKKDSDRFQYILPEFTFQKNLVIPDNYNGNFNFVSSGFQKNYDTNIYETLLINDFLFQSNDIVSEIGFLNNYDLLIKNFNSYTENSSGYKEKEDYEIFGSLLLKSSYPLKKINKKSTDYLKPIMAIKYSPNNTKNISDKDLRLDFDNIFALNRIGTNEIVEGGKSVSLGLGYEKRNLEDQSIVGFNFANSISYKKNSNLPSKSKLDQTRTDIVGNLFYTPIVNTLKFDYTFSYDRDLDFSNYDSVGAKLDLDNFSTTFKFITENHELGDTEILSNNTTFNFNEENSLQFATTKNLRDDFTEYYNLIYAYETDCLSATATYNKQFYNNANMVPTETLYFLIKFIPFTEVRGSANTYVKDN